MIEFEHYESFWRRSNNTKKSIIQPYNSGTNLAIKNEFHLWPILLIILILASLFIYRNFVYDEPPPPNIVCPQGEKLITWDSGRTINIFDYFTWFEETWACTVNGGKMPLEFRGRF